MRNLESGQQRMQNKQMTGCQPNSEYSSTTNNSTANISSSCSCKQHSIVVLQGPFTIAEKPK